MPDPIPAEATDEQLPDGKEFAGLDVPPPPEKLTEAREATEKPTEEAEEQPTEGAEEAADEETPTEDEFDAEEQKLIEAAKVAPEAVNELLEYRERKQTEAEAAQIEKKSAEIVDTVPLKTQQAFQFKQTASGMRQNENQLKSQCHQVYQQQQQMIQDVETEIRQLEQEGVENPQEHRTVQRMQADLGKIETYYQNLYQHWQQSNTGTQFLDQIDDEVQGVPDLEEYKALYAAMRMLPPEKGGIGANMPLVNRIKAVKAAAVRGGLVQAGAGKPAPVGDEVKERIKKLRVKVGGRGNQARQVTQKEGPKLPTELKQTLEGEW